MDSSVTHVRPHTFPAPATARRPPTANAARDRQLDHRLDTIVALVSTLHRHEDVYVALRDASDSVARQLEDVVRVKRGDVKNHEVPLHGRIVRLFPDDAGGFIESSDGRELYFSRANVVHPAFEYLETGMALQLLEELADEGWQAKRVSVGRHGDLTVESSPERG